MIYGMTQEQYEQMRMQHKAQNDAIYDFIGNLTPEQAYTFWMIVQSHVHDGDNAKITLGIIMGQLRYKHEACMCGEKFGFHTLAEHIEQPDDSPTPQKSEGPQDSSQPGQIEVDLSDADLADLRKLSSRGPVVYDPQTGVTWDPTVWAEQDADLDQAVLDDIDNVLDKYKLTVLTVPGKTSHGEYACTRCKHSYPSITDRMLKGPDQCQYCQDLEAHGGMSPFD